MKNKIIILIFTVFLLANTTYQVQAKNIKTKKSSQKAKTRLHFNLLAGYAIPINASYVDTYENQDIYWNPNSGFNLELRLTYHFTDLIRLAFPLDIVIGLYQYTTTDGRKVNTEAQAGNEPLTTNTEWSIAPNFVPIFQVKPHMHPAVPYIGFGLGIGILWSFETWDFINADDKRTVLVINKYYYPTPLFKGEIGWDIPLTNRFHFRIASTFNLANYIMYRVELSHYYVDGQDNIGDYDEKSRYYTYGFDMPDENKGGDCLLAGFTYQNYPQQKIATNLAVKIGFSYNF